MPQSYNDEIRSQSKHLTDADGKEQQHFTFPNWLQYAGFDTWQKSNPYAEGGVIDSATQTDVIPGGPIHELAVRRTDPRELIRRYGTAKVREVMKRMNLFADGGSTVNVRSLWEQRTGLPWSDVGKYYKEYDRSRNGNLKLRSALLRGEYDYLNKNRPSTSVNDVPAEDSSPGVYNLSVSSRPYSNNITDTRNVTTDANIMDVMPSADLLWTTPAALMPVRDNTAIRHVPLDIYNSLWDTDNLQEKVNMKAIDKNDDLKWMNKDQIKDLQTQLIEAGFLSDRKNTDGTYAEADGKIGKRTREALDRYFDDRSGENDRPVLPNTVDQLIKSFDKNNPDSIKKVQDFLIRHQYLKPEDAKGGWGNKSQAALERMMDHYKELQENTLSRNIYDNISIWSRTKNLIGAIGDHTLNQLGRITIGTKKGNELADKVERGEMELEDLPDTTLGNNNLLTDAEKQMALAILTYKNKNKPLTYQDYLKEIKKQGKKEGEFVGIDQASYKFANEIEDRYGYDGVKGNNLITRVINTGRRIFHDPNRGRLGSWCYLVEPDGTIVISDNFGATEKTAAIGKNDNSGYNSVRAIWFRGTQHPIKDKITPEQQKKWLENTKKT